MMAPHFTGSGGQGVEVFPIGDASEGWVLGDQPLYGLRYRINRHKAAAVRRVANHPAHDLIGRIAVVDDQFMVGWVREGGPPKKYSRPACVASSGRGFGVL